MTDFRTAREFARGYGKGAKLMQAQSEFEAMCDAVYKGASRASMAVLIVPGAVADDLGGQGLQIVCNRSGRNLITDRDSKFHAGKLFRPAAG